MLKNKVISPKYSFVRDQFKFIKFMTKRDEDGWEVPMEYYKAIVRAQKKLNKYIKERGNSES